PIYYVTAAPHIGHAYTTIAADACARFQRLMGKDVFFVTGTDEHGGKNLEAARAAGISAQEHVDQQAAVYKRVFEESHCEFDRFIRTTEPEHVDLVQRIFQKLKDQGDIYKGEYEGWYCVPCETYLLDKDLQEGNCPDCKREVTRTTTESYFFRTSKYADRILKALEEKPDFIGPEGRKNEVASFIKRGLQDACISRKASEWDIPVKDDPDQTIYVWFDALVNYLTAAGYDPDDDATNEWWPASVQVMAKDILVRFHATIWPAMLMALDLPLPEVIFAHGWWLSPDESRGDDAAERKISKSRGDLVSPVEIAKDLAEISGARLDIAMDAVRYFVLSEVTFGLDGVFSIDAVMRRFNDDLANDLGNLLNRTLPLVERFVDGKVPDPGDGAGAAGDPIAKARDGAAAAMDKLDFSGALTSIWGLISFGNRYVDEKAPWDLHKEGKTAERDAVLYDLLDCLHAVALLVQPFMPMVAKEILAQLGLSDADGHTTWDSVAGGALAVGGEIKRDKPIFPRIDMKRPDAQAEAQPKPKDKPKKAKKSEPETSEITFDDFMKLDFRVAEIIAAKNVEGKDRLLELPVSLGDETRTIAAGIAEQYPPETLVGKRVVLVANLKPAKIGGVESHG
ncbi:MAG TPA: methionine--tRNA ligase, partial [Armatimonadota bacterium]|nr:methionine--tRNA ligase [Armatimonadota bacterium]